MNFIELLLAILPAYVANSAPVVFGGGDLIHKKLFGESKTWRGLTSGIAFGFAVGVILAFALGNEFLAFLSVSEKIGFAALLSVGGVCGDLAGSFVKRRLGVPSGHPSPFLDQLPFVLMALGFGLAAFPKAWPAFEAGGLAFVIVLTYFLHLAFNRWAHKLGLKKVPW